VIELLGKKILEQTDQPRDRSTTSSTSSLSTSATSIGSFNFANADQTVRFRTVSDSVPFDTDKNVSVRNKNYRTNIQVNICSSIDSSIDGWEFSNAPSPLPFPLNSSTPSGLDMNNFRSLESPTTVQMAGILEKLNIFHECTSAGQPISKTLQNGVNSAISSLTTSIVENDVVHLHELTPDHALSDSLAKDTQKLVSHLGEFEKCT